jgi:hypothetical protein
MHRREDNIKLSTDKEEYDPIQEKGCWHHRWNSKICSLHKDLSILYDIKIRTVGCTGHIRANERRKDPKKVSGGKFPQNNISMKTKKKMGGHSGEGCITVSRSTRTSVQETGWE